VSKPKKPGPLPGILWGRAKTVVIPIPKTGTKFRQYPDLPPRSCEVTASFRFLPVGEFRGKAWAWRIKLDTPLYHDDDPLCDKRPAVHSQERAIELAVAKILMLLRGDLEIRRHARQTEVASTLAQAVWHVENFASHLAKTGTFLTQAIVPAIKDSPPLLTFDPKSRSNGKTPRASNLTPPPPIVVNVPSTPLDKLTTGERRLLAQREKEIERSAHAFLDLGNALAEIQEKLLYRATHGTFEGYLTERWHMERSVAYQYIDAKRRYDLARPIAEKLKLEFTAESQLRELRGVDSAGDMKAVLQRAAKLVEADSDGIKRPTAKVLARAVHEDKTDPDELKREAAEARRKAHDRTTHDPRPTTHASELIDCAEREESVAADAHGAINGDTRQWRDLLADPPPPADGSDPGYWNGQKVPWAGQLRGLSNLLDQIIASFPPTDMARGHLASLLRSHALELETAELQPSPRRAK